jgi:hypothetical protein
VNCAADKHLRDMAEKLREEPPPFFIEERKKSESQPQKIKRRLSIENVTKKLKRG